jgi:paraquat-inducible protein B
MSETLPAVSTKRRISPLWIIPIVAIIGGVWVFVHAYLTEGPTVRISMSTAEGLVPGKTKVKVLNVEVGLLEAVVLNPDLSGVTATVKLALEVRDLLRDDTQFWVVRARIGASGVSGLDTLLSGAYIEMAPGNGSPGRRDFAALENQPLTESGTPGIRVTLISDHAASLGVGDPILHQGLPAGRIESLTFEPERGVVYSAFIQTPYDQSLNTSSRFWDASGVSINAGADGVSVKVGSVDTILIGGAEFGSLPEVPEGSPIEDGAVFRLYSSYGETLEDPFSHGTHYVVEFADDIGGLQPGSPVRYRGILIGRVERLLLRELTTRQLERGEYQSERGAPIPVLLFLEPARLEAPDTRESVDALRVSIETGISNGLRAALKTANLLTGQQAISLDFYPDAPEAEAGRFGEYVSIPTMDIGFGRIQNEVTDLLAKLNALPIEATLAGANRTLSAADTALGSLDEALTTVDSFLKGDATQALPVELVDAVVELRNVLDGVSQDSMVYENLDASLDRLSRTLENLERLSRKLSDQPNAVIFSTPPDPDPEPESRK